MTKLNEHLQKLPGNYLGPVGDVDFLRVHRRPAGLILLPGNGLPQERVSLLRAVAPKRLLPGSWPRPRRCSWTATA